MPGAFPAPEMAFLGTTVTGFAAGDSPRYSFGSAEAEPFQNITTLAFQNVTTLAFQNFTALSTDSRFRTLCLLHRQQGFFSFDAPAVSAHAAVFADHAMAWDRDCNRIRRTGTCHGADRGWPADRSGHLAV